MYVKNIAYPKTNIQMTSIPTGDIMSLGREIKCPFCDSTRYEYVKTYVYRCLKCEEEFNVLEHSESLLLYEGLTYVSGAEIPPNTIPLRLAIVRGESIGG